MGRFSFFGKKQDVKKQSDTVNPKTYDGSLPRFVSLNIDSGQDNFSDFTLLKLYNEVAEPNAIINYIASVAATVPVEHVFELANGKEKEVKNSDIIKLLNNPNQFVSGNQLAETSFIYYFVTGDIIQNWIKPVGFRLPSQIYLIPSENVYPITNGSYEPYGTLNTGIDIRTQQIKKYNWIVDSKIYPLLPEEVLHIKDTSIGGISLKGNSKLRAATRNIKTLSYACQTINTLLANQGSLGIISRNSKAGEQDAGMWSEEIDKVSEKFHANYGTQEGQKAKLLTPADLKYTPITEPLSTFQPIELSDHEFKVLCKVLGGFPESLLQTTDSTFTNMGLARKLLFENIIIPLLDYYYQSITNFCRKRGWITENESIKPDYDDIEALQDDIKVKAEGEKVNDEVWINRYNNNLITENELLTALDLKTKPDGNRYKNEIDPGTNQQNPAGQTQEGDGTSNNQQE